MANRIEAHTIMNGSRNLMIQYHMIADASGDYSNFELFNLNDYTGEDQQAANNFSVVKVEGQSASGATVRLLFGSSTGNHKEFFASSVDEMFIQEWSPALKNQVADKDLTIRMTTTAFTSANLVLTVLIWLKKKHSLEQA